MVYNKPENGGNDRFSAAKMGVAKIAARFARHFIPSTPLKSKILDPAPEFPQLSPLLMIIIIIIIIIIISNNARKERKESLINITSNNSNNNRKSV